VVAIILLVTFAFVAFVVLTVRAGIARSAERPSSPRLEGPYRGLAEVRVVEGPTEARSLDVSREALRKQAVKGLLLGLLVSPLVGFPIALFAFQLPILGTSALPAWVFGPYAYAVVAAQRGPRSRATAIGFLIGHSVAIAGLWLAAVKLFEGLSVGIGGG
jgi:hypothetical protein